MKKVILFILILLFFSCKNEAPSSKNGGDKNEVQGKKLYTIALSGLNIRKAPTLKSEVVGKIPFGEEITQLKESTETAEIKVGIKTLSGYWHEIRYRDITGYAFSEFLFPEKLEMTEVKVMNFIESPSDSFNGLIYSDTPESSLMKKFGKPLFLQSEQIKNIHNGEMDTIKSYRYPGFSVHIYFAKKIKKQLLQRIVIFPEFTSKLRYLKSFPADKKKILSCFGKATPENTQKNTMTYSPELAEGGYITVSLKDGKVASIEVGHDFI